MYLIFAFCTSYLYFVFCLFIPFPLFWQQTELLKWDSQNLFWFYSHTKNFLQTGNSLRPRKKTQKYASNFDLKKPGKSGTITRAAFPPFLPTTNILRFPPCLQQNISSIHITCLANLASGDERVQQISDIVMKTLRVLLGTGFIGLASGHGNIVQPPAWFHRCADNILEIDFSHKTWAHLIYHMTFFTF